ncbi:hypothetical protein ACLOJK_014963 [Asimina triloba]
MVGGKEVEDLERWNEENLRLGLALSREEARRSCLFIASPKVPTGPASGGGGGSPPGLVSSPVLVGDVDGVDAPGVETFVPRREGSLSGGGAPVRCGVLTSIFGEASSYPSNEEIFRQPFDIEVKAMKILEDVLLVESRGDGPASRCCGNIFRDVWKELLELGERICLVDGCAFGEEYREASKDYRRREAPRGGGSEAVASGVLRFDAPLSSERKLMEEWELIEEACAKARGITRKRLEAEGERCHAEGMTEASRCFLLQLLEMGRCAHRADGGCFALEARLGAGFGRDRDGSWRSALSAEPPVPNPGAASPCVCDTGLNVGGGSPLSGKALAEVVRLRTELKALRAERLQGSRLSARPAIFSLSAGVAYGG